MHNFSAVSGIVIGCGGLVRLKSLNPSRFGWFPRQPYGIRRPAVRHFPADGPEFHHERLLSGLAKKRSVFCFGAGSMVASFLPRRTLLPSTSSTKGYAPTPLSPAVKKGKSLSSLARKRENVRPPTP